MYKKTKCYNVGQLNKIVSSLLFIHIKGKTLIRQVIIQVNTIQ